MIWVRVPAAVTAAVTGLIFFAFGAAWHFGSGRGQSPTGASTPVPSPTAQQASPARAPAPPVASAAATPEPAPEPAPLRQRTANPVAPVLPGPVRLGGTAPAGRRAAAAPAFHEMPAQPSRWTRTFGPPDTGQIPLQPYRAGISPYAAADADLPDRRQRSHSSL